MGVIVLIAAVGRRLAYIVGDSGSPQSRAADADGQAVIDADGADALGALAPDWVGIEKRLDLFDGARETVAKLLGSLEPAFRGIAPQPARYDPRRHHPDAGDHLLH